MPAAIGLAFLTLPMVGLLARVPWARLGEILADEAAAQALWLSLRTCLAATSICLVLGVPLALVLARGRGRWVAFVRTLVSLPMVLPPVVAGLALLVTLGRRGLLGATLRFLGVEIGFTTAAVVLAQAFVSMPFLVASVEGAARAANVGYERVAASLGATPTRTLARVTLPLLAPAVLTGACLAFARSLGEFGATLTFAGSFQGVTQTMPIQVYLRRETDPDLALALAFVLLVVAGAVVGVTATIQGRLGEAAPASKSPRPLSPESLRRLSSESRALSLSEGRAGAGEFRALSLKGGKGAGGSTLRRAQGSDAGASLQGEGSTLRRAQGSSAGASLQGEGSTLRRAQGLNAGASLQGEGSTLRRAQGSNAGEFRALSLSKGRGGSGGSTLRRAQGSNAGASLQDEGSALRRAQGSSAGEFRALSLSKGREGPGGAALFLRARVASRDIEVEFSVPAGKVVALVGPNGAGKSTVIDLVTGFLRPDSGTIEIAGRPVTGAGHVPTHRRGVALLAQTPLLFPHLDVATNAAFAPRCSGVPRGAAGRRARDELNALECADLAARWPQQLSGGQAQRVALARALAADPVLLCLDEPFAALDVSAVPAARHALRHRLQQRRTAALLVTHDLLDVLSLADEVVVLVEGRVVEQGPVAQVVPRPRSRFLAELAGVNLLAGTAVAQDSLDLGAVRLIGLPDEPLCPGRPALAAVPPAAVSIHALPPGGSPRNTMPGVVETIEPRGPVVRVNTDIGGQRLAADVTPAAVAELDLVPGSRIHLVVKATQIVLYPSSRE